MAKWSGRHRAASVAGALAVVMASVVSMVAPAAAVVTCPAPPVAHDDSYTTSYRKAIMITAPGVLKNDTGTGLKVSVADSDSTSFSDGKVQLFTGGRFTYTPNKAFSGLDSFDYWII